MFTRRERHVLILVVLTIAALLVAAQIRVTEPHTFLQKRLLVLSDIQSLEDWAIYLLVLYVLPLGIYLDTDKEHIERINNDL